MLYHLLDLEHNITLQPVIMQMEGKEVGEILITSQFDLIRNGKMISVSYPREVKERMTCLVARL